MTNKLYAAILIVMTISMFIEAKPIFFLDNSRCQFAGLPVAAGQWLAGQQVQFQYRWQFMPKETGTFSLSLDSLVHRERVVDFPRASGPDVNGWYTMSTTLPVDLPYAIDWRFKFENAIGLDVCESPVFTIGSGYPNTVASNNAAGVVSMPLPNLI